MQVNQGTRNEPDNIWQMLALMDTGHAGVGGTTTKQGLVDIEGVLQYGPVAL